MFKIVLLFVALALFAEGKPSYATDLAEAAKSGNWGLFQALFNQEIQNAQFPLAGSVESLQKPDGGGHVFGQAVSYFSSSRNDNGKVTKQSGGLEVTNNDGQITRREFTP